MRVLARRARRRGCVLAALVTLAIPSCRTTRAGGDGTQPPRYLGDFRGAPTEVDPAFADAWSELQAAVAADAGSAATVAAADRLLSAGPPFELRLWGVHAKAQHAYLNGDDAGAISMADQVLAASTPESSPDAISALALVRVRALVRSGDAVRALASMDEPALRREGVLIPSEEAALRAIALDRAGRPEALAALVRWRATIEVDDAAAAFAQRRAAALATTLGPKATALAAAAEQGAARACLEGLAGLGVPADAAPWITRCRAAPQRIGILLPRTGPLAALADTQLAAATATVALLGPSHPQIGEVLWHDSGADAASAADGAAALVASGATVIVGPIGPAAVRAARARLGASVRVLTPGEPVGDVSGAAPTLERRVAALVDVALARDAKRVIVFAPDSAYGKRAQAAAIARLGKAHAPVLIVYPLDTTSFASFTDPIVKSLDARTAVLVADQASRTEMLVRQLARDGKGPASKGGPLVLATAEGISDVEAGAGHDVLANMVVAPTAATTAAAEAFAAAYRAAEGVPPPDQALLVHRALQIAFGGEEAGDAPVVLVKVQGGRLVVQAAP
jgi:ABC-type branched-subunit amino acid transport system substrate-binding protein